MCTLGASPMNYPAAIVVAFACIASGCQQVPVTGRPALNLVKHEDVVRVGIASFERAKRTPGLSPDRSQGERLRRVGERISQAAFWDAPDAEWEFVVLKGDTVNAFSAPGGKVAIYSGFFKVVANDDQLAWVVAHEVAHLVARHADERISRQMLAKAGAVAAVVGLAASPAAVAGQAGLQAYEISTALANLSFDRKQELEADKMALLYMARAGFDPEEGVKAFQNMAAYKTTNGLPVPVDMFSTHPAYPERNLHLIDQVPKAREIFLREQQQQGTRVRVLR